MTFHLGVNGIPVTKYQEILTEKSGIRIVWSRPPSPKKSAPGLKSSQKAPRCENNFIDFRQFDSETSTILVKMQNQTTVMVLG